MATTKIPPATTTPKKEPALHTIGRRKSSAARAFVSKGEGKITINGKSYEDYFGRETSRMVVRQPLEATDTMGKFDIVINVRGGGSSGQAGAIRLAIARALLETDETFRVPLRKGGYLTRDAREVERKKPGRRKARRRSQFSKR